MNPQYIAIILHITNILAYLLIVILPSLSQGIMEKKNYYGKDHWICYTNNISKGLLLSITVGTFATLFPRVVENAYAKIILLSLCLIVLVLTRIFLWRYESCICLDSQKITVKYNRKGMDDKVFNISNFVTYRKKEGSHPAKLVFTENEEIDLGFLREQQATMVFNAVNRIKIEGELPDYNANLKVLEELAAGVKQRMESATSAPEDKSDSEFDS